MDNTKIRILVAEDEASLRDLLVLILEDEEYQVDAASDGSDAWELMNKNHYHILATDLYMPKMNGIELILACQESFPQTKIILLSGGGKEIEAEHGTRQVKYLGQELKVDVFLKKPCNLDDMLAAVERLLHE